MPMDRGDWLAPASLDSVTISVEMNRDLGGSPIDLTVTGHSKKRVAPLWTWSHRETDDRNIESVLGGIMGAVVYYRPVTPVSFLRACTGGEMHGMEEMFPE